MFYILDYRSKNQSSQVTTLVFVLALPIFPARLQASIVGASELNFRVRDGNGWTLTAINTNLLFLERKSKQKELCAGSGGYVCEYLHPAATAWDILCRHYCQHTVISRTPCRFCFLLSGEIVLKVCTFKTEQRNHVYMSKRLHSSFYSNLSFSGQALGLLVPVSCIHYCTSTSGLSTT